MLKISLLIGLILVGNGFCEIFQNSEPSNEEDLMASAATLFGPKTFGLQHANLGNFGPLGYGGIGGMRIGSIGPLHYGHIGGIHTDSFLGAPNPNAQEDEYPGTIGTPTGDSLYQEIVGGPMEQNWQEMNDEENFIGMEMEPFEQEMYELGLQPQVPEDARVFANEGLFGLKKDKFEKIPLKPALPPKIPPKFSPPPPPPPPPVHYPPSIHYPPSNDYYGGYGSHGHSHGSGHGHEYSGHGHGYSGHIPSYRGYGSHGSSHLHSHSNIHSLGYNKYGSHSHRPFNSYHHGIHSGSYQGGFGSSLFRSNDEDQTMIPYESNNQFQDMQQIKNVIPIVTTVTHQQHIICVHQIPHSQPSARSSVDDILDGLDDIGFDFEFRDLIEGVFLQPYLGLLDPNDLDDDTLLLL